MVNVEVNYENILRKHLGSRKGINVSDQRRKELEEQFPEDFADIHQWLDLAMVWMKRI